MAAFLGEVNEVASADALVVAIRLLDKIVVELLGHAGHLGPLRALVQHELPNANAARLRHFEGRVGDSSGGGARDPQVLAPLVAVARADDQQIAVVLDEVRRQNGRGQVDLEVAPGALAPVVDNDGRPAPHDADHAVEEAIAEDAARAVELLAREHAARGPRVGRELVDSSHGVVGRS